MKMATNHYTQNMNFCQICQNNMNPSTMKKDVGNVNESPTIFVHNCSECKSCHAVEKMYWHCEKCKKCHPEDVTDCKGCPYCLYRVQYHFAVNTHCPNCLSLLIEALCCICGKVGIHKLCGTSPVCRTCIEIKEINMFGR